MLKAINQWCYPSDYDIFQCIETSAKLGYEGFEPAFTENGWLSPKTSAADLARVVRSARDCGVRLTSLATGVYWVYSLSSTDSGIRAKARDILCRQIDCAAALGADTILALAGIVDRDTPYDDAYNYARESISSVLGYAESAGVVIGLENVWNRFLLSPLETRAFIESFNSPYVRMYFDAGNVLAFGFPEQWIRILGKLIAKVHIKDFRISVGTADGFVDLLSGDVDFPRVMDALRETGYDGAIIAEVPPAAHYPLEGARRISQAMNSILGRS